MRHKGHPSYMAWVSMRQRCNNKKHPQYPDYGGRGISVCRAWDDFKNFARDMGDKPESFSLDRINNDKGYSKKNCRWATAKQQANNRRFPEQIRVKFNGESLTWHEWAKETEIPYDTLKRRQSRGWSVERTLVEPLRAGSLLRRENRRNTLK